MREESEENARIAAHLFERARAVGVDNEVMTLFDAVGQTDYRRAMAISLEVLALWEGAGEKLGGWKAGLTSRGARDSMGPGFRPFAPILESRIFASGAEISLSAATFGLKLEPEICFTMGKGLKGEVTPEEARAAVATVHPSFELIERRLFSGLSRPHVRLSDGIGQWGVVLGPGIAPDFDPFGLKIELLQGDTVVESAVTGPELLDDPYLSVARVCRELAHFGRAIEPGQKIITGNLVRQPLVLEPDLWTACFEIIGKVDVRFVP